MPVEFWPAGSFMGMEMASSSRIDAGGLLEWQTGAM
jgi:hypothetical protein